MRCSGKHGLWVVFLVFSSLITYGDKADLFSIRGKTYGFDDLPKKHRQALYEIERNMQNQIKQVFDSYLMEKYVKQVESDEVSEAEAKTWYDANKERVGGRSFASIKDDLINYLSQKAYYENRLQALESKRKSLNFQTKLKPRFKEQVFAIDTEGFPVKGKSSSPVTIVEFADYQCPHCRQMSFDLQDIQKQFKDKVKIVFIDFPINPSGVSEEIAHGAFCAHKQNSDKFWEYNHRAFQNQSTLVSNSAEVIAKNIGLDMKRFKSCLVHPETVRRINQARELARELGVGGTPTLFVNGVKQVAYSKESLIETIKKF